MIYESLSIPVIMEPQKHSGLGIASFAISLVTAVCILAMFVIAGVLETSTPGGMDEDGVEVMMIGLGIIFFLGIAIVGLALGITGCALSGRKKVFAILGTVINVLLLFGTVFLILLGLLMD